MSWQCPQKERLPPKTSDLGTEAELFAKKHAAIGINESMAACRLLVLVM